MDDGDLARALEALIFAAHGPASSAQLKRAFPDLTAAQLAEAVKQTNEQLAETGRPYEIVEVAGGYQFRTRGEFGPVIARAQPERKVRLSHAALDTLAVIAYRQPITRAEIEELRSVDCGAVIRSLLERSLLRVLGRRDAPGRPALYGTTGTFLEVFGLRSLRDLPELRELIEPPAETGTPIEEAGGTLPDPAIPQGDAALGLEPPPPAPAEPDAAAAEPLADPEPMAEHTAAAPRAAPADLEDDEDLDAELDEILGRVSGGEGSASDGGADGGDDPEDAGPFE